MQFRIADTFTDSLSKLTGDEQKAVKTAAFDLPMNPAHPGLKLHQVDRAKEPLAKLPGDWGWAQSSALLVNTIALDRRLDILSG